NKSVATRPEEIVKYSIKYEITESIKNNSPFNGPFTIVFDDTLGREKPASIIPGAREIVDEKESPNYIEYAKDFKTRLSNGSGPLIEKCTDEQIKQYKKGTKELEMCYTGDIALSKILDGIPYSADPNSNILTYWNITFPNNKIIYFSYDGKVNWQDYEYCQRNNKGDPTPQQECPGDKFPNTARVYNITESRWDTDDAVVYVTCPYILTRKGGDVFFEKGLLSGVDVSCIDKKVRNSEGLVIVAQPKVKVRPLISTGTPGQTPSVCDNKNINIVNHFSSFICEIQTRVYKNWEKTSVQLNVGDNKTRVSRFNESLDKTANIENYEQDLILQRIQPNTYNNVFYKKNGDITIKGKELTKCLPDPHNYKAGRMCPSLIIPNVEYLADNLLAADADKNAARTIIIENGNLFIKSNIVYDKPTGDVKNHRERPAIAFIVLNGNIIVGENVNRMDGVYFVKNHPTNNKVGNFKSYGTDSFQQLVINGAVYGDLDPLAADRKYIGAPDRDGGAIVIRYDENILLNTPPGIEEYIDMNWLRKAR
ncbi:hypothetical protein KKG71_04005, partial [Patescibacteria group bacterium]|nr:hypothetical protein [Patescibacteria group bacterium]